MQQIQGCRVERGSDCVLGGVCSGIDNFFSVNTVGLPVALIWLGLLLIARRLMK